MLFLDFSTAFNTNTDPDTTLSSSLWNCLLDYLRNRALPDWIHTTQVLGGAPSHLLYTLLTYGCSVKHLSSVQTHSNKSVRKKVNNCSINVKMQNIIVDKEREALSILFTSWALLSRSSSFSSNCTSLPQCSIVKKVQQHLQLLRRNMVVLAPMPSLFSTDTCQRMSWGLDTIILHSAADTQALQGEIGTAYSITGRSLPTISDIYNSRYGKRPPASWGTLPTLPTDHPPTPLSLQAGGYQASRPDPPGWGTASSWMLWLWQILHLTVQLLLLPLFHHIRKLLHFNMENSAVKNELNCCFSLNNIHLSLHIYSMFIYSFYAQ